MRQFKATSRDEVRVKLLSGEISKSQVETEIAAIKHSEEIPTPQEIITVLRHLAKHMAMQDMGESERAAYYQDWVYDVQDCGVTRQQLDRATTEWRRSDTAFMPNFGQLYALVHKSKYKESDNWASMLKFYETEWPQLDDKSKVSLLQNWLSGAKSRFRNYQDVEWMKKQYGGEIDAIEGLLSKLGAPCTV